MGTRYVIWSRIDQKSCFKSILTAGLEPVVVELSKRGEELVTDLEGIREEVDRLGPDNVLAIMTCTRCLAIRLFLLFIPFHLAALLQEVLMTCQGWLKYAKK